MLSYFRTKLFPSTTVAEPPATHAKCMDLEGRKAFRQEMLYQSIRETFLSIQVIGSMYKFKTLPVDERHHRFAVMIDVTEPFLVATEARIMSFSTIEVLLRENTYNRFSVLIAGVYWRLNESEPQFVPRERTVAAMNAAGTSATRQPCKTPFDWDSTAPILACHASQAVSDDEIKAFIDARRNGSPLPVAHVVDEEYQSELGPLDDGVVIGGTRYGKRASNE